MRTGISVALASVAAWVMALNWFAVAMRVTRRRHASWVPLLGGALAMTAMRIYPDPRIYRWLWVPLIIDWGCLPGFLDTLRVVLARSRR